MRIPFVPRSMEAEDTARLEVLVRGSPLLPDATLRKHWQKVIAWLPPAAKYELAEILRSAEDAWRD